MPCAGMTVTTCGEGFVAHEPSCFNVIYWLRAPSKQTPSAGCGEQRLALPTLSSEHSCAVSPPHRPLHRPSSRSFPQNNSPATQKPGAEQSRAWLAECAQRLAHRRLGGVGAVRCRQTTATPCAAAAGRGGGQIAVGPGQIEPAFQWVTGAWQMAFSLRSGCCMCGHACEARKTRLAARRLAGSGGVMMLLEVCRRVCSACPELSGRRWLRVARLTSGARPAVRQPAGGDRQPGHGGAQPLLRALCCLSGTPLAARR